MNISSYGKVYNLGHRAAEGITDAPCRVEEKVDGSQFSFKENLPDPVTGERGEIEIRSKRQPIHPEQPQKMFLRAVTTVMGLYRDEKLTPGWTYRGEAFQGNRHNILTYERAPNGGVILYDVDTGMEGYMRHADLSAEADKLGLEVVPLLYEGVVTLEKVKELLDTESILGGVKVEGVVLKRVVNDAFQPDGKPTRAKFVSEAFKETHRSKSKKPTKDDLLTEISEVFATEARWDKAVQALSEMDLITQSPKDIGPLIKRVQDDVLSECTDEIKDLLFGFYAKRIRGAVVKGLPQWYKEKLAESEFA